LSQYIIKYMSTNRVVFQNYAHSNVTFFLSYE